MFIVDINGEHDSNKTKVGKGPAGVGSERKKRVISRIIPATPKLSRSESPEPVNMSPNIVEGDNCR
jgi:hypothetical protein